MWYQTTILAFKIEPHQPVESTVLYVRKQEANVLFNDALNTFYLRFMVSDIWLRTILIVRKETRCCHIGYSYRLTARIILYAPSLRQDNTYHGLCYTSRGALAGTRISSMGPPHEGSIRRPIALPLSYVALPVLYVTTHMHRRRSGSSVVSSRLRPS